MSFPLSSLDLTSGSIVKSKDVESESVPPKRQSAVAFHSAVGSPPSSIADGGNSKKRRTRKFGEGLQMHEDALPSLTISGGIPISHAQTHKTLGLEHVKFPQRSAPSTAFFTGIKSGWSDVDEDFNVHQAFPSLVLLDRTPRPMLAARPAPPGAVPMHQTVINSTICDSNPEPQGKICL